MTAIEKKQGCWKSSWAQAWYRQNSKAKEGDAQAARLLVERVILQIFSSACQPQIFCYVTK